MAARVLRLPRSRLERLALACLALLAVDLIVLYVGFGTCLGEGVGCASWHEWMNLITYLAAPVLTVLALVAGIAALAARMWGKRPPDVG